jgi:NitT/TauT family transport system substrate-binding protein
MKSIATSFACVLMAAGLIVPAAAAPVRIGMAVGDDVSTAPAYVAEKLGYFKDAKVEVEIAAYRGGAAAQEALSAGAADMISYFGAGVGLAVSKGAKEKMVATASGEALGWLMLANGKSGIKTVKDLAGKKVGVTVKGSTSDMFALWAADHNGVSIQTIPLGGGALVPSLRNGQVDAVVLWPGLSYKTVQTEGAAMLIDFGKDMIPTMATVYVASQDLIDKRPQELRATLAAIYKGLGYMRDNRAWSIDFLKSYGHEDNEKVNAETYEQVVMKLPRDGAIDRKWIENSLQLASKSWEMPDLLKMDPAKLYTNEFHPQAK